MHERSYAVLGTGAMGGYYGANLNRVGHEVHFLFHHDAEYVRKHGLRMESPNGDFELPKVYAYSAVKDMPRCDVVCIGVKSTHNHLLSELLPPVVKPGGSVLVMQNGLGMEEGIAPVVPECTVIGVQCYLCSNKVGPGHIRHIDYGRITMGAWGEPDQNRMEAIAADFRSAGIPADITPDLATARWKKLAWNIPYNGLCVVLDTTTDKLMNDPQARDLVTRILTEVVQGAQACGCDVADNYVNEMLEFTDKMAPYLPSMKLDYDAGAPMEIEYMYRKPLEAARRAGVELPHIGMLYDQLRFLAGQKPGCLSST